LAIILHTVTHSGLTGKRNGHKRSCNADENKYKKLVMKIKLNYKKAPLENKTFPTVTLKDEKIKPNST
jgi:hypothetical protein